MFIGPVSDAMALLSMSENKELWWMEKDKAGRITLPQELLLPIQATFIDSGGVAFIVDDDNVLWLLHGPSTDEPSFVFHVTNVRFKHRVRLFHLQKVFLTSGTCLYLERDDLNITVKRLRVDETFDVKENGTVQHQDYDEPARISFEGSFKQPIKHIACADRSTVLVVDDNDVCFHASLVRLDDAVCIRLMKKITNCTLRRNKSNQMGKSSFESVCDMRGAITFCLSSGGMLSSVTHGVQSGSYGPPTRHIQYVEWTEIPSKYHSGECIFPLDQKPPKPVNVQ